MPPDIVALGRQPDIVVAGTFTSVFTQKLLRDLGYTVIEIAPENSIADIERNIEIVGAALQRSDRAAQVVRDMREHVAKLAAARRPELATAVVVRPGGFTVGAHTLADELMKLAGLRNIAAESGLGPQIGIAAELRRARQGEEAGHLERSPHRRVDAAVIPAWPPAQAQPRAPLARMVLREIEAGSDLHGAAASIADKNKIPYLGVAFAFHGIHKQGLRYLFSPFPKSPDLTTETFVFLDGMIPAAQRPRKVALFLERTDWGK